jgi:hypothetical protein
MLKITNSLVKTRGNIKNLDISGNALSNVKNINLSFNKESIIENLRILI